MSRNGNSDIPGAPSWVRHLLGRIDDRFDVLSAQMHDYGREAAKLEAKLDEQTAELKERVSKTEAEIVELKEKLRSLTPPGGIPAVTPPDDAA